MNTVLGIFLLISNGQIEGAHAVAAYPNQAACLQGVSQYIKTQVEEKGPPPDGITLAKMCVDLTDDLKQKPPSVKT